MNIILTIMLAVNIYMAIQDQQKALMATIEFIEHGW